MMNISEHRLTADRLCITVFLTYVISKSRHGSKRIVYSAFSKKSFTGNDPVSTMNDTGVVTTIVIGMKSRSGKIRKVGSFNSNFS